MNRSTRCRALVRKVTIAGAVLAGITGLMSVGPARATTEPPAAEAATTTSTPPTTPPTTPAPPTTTPVPPTTAAPTPPPTTAAPIEAPGAPTNAGASASGGGVLVTWSPPGSGGPVDQYKVMHKAGGDWELLVRLPSSARSYQVSGLNGGTHQFRIQATNAGGVSGPSNSVSVTLGGGSNQPSTDGGDDAPAAPTTPTTPTLRPPTDRPAGNCALPAYPSALCTGVTSTEGLRRHEGDLHVTTPGTVIDGWLITGQLIVETSDVVIRNSVIYGGVSSGWQVPGTSYTIENSTVGQEGTCVDGVGVGGADYTASGLRVVGFADGFRISGSNISITGSYATMCQAGCTHSDGVQAVDAAGATDITIAYNVFDLRAVTDPCAMNCPIFLPTDQNPGITATIEDNVLAGGQSGLCLWDEGGGSFPSVSGNLVVEGSTSAPISLYCSNVGAADGNAVIAYDWATGEVTRVVSQVSAC